MRHAGDRDWDRASLVRDLFLPVEILDAELDQGWRSTKEWSGVKTSLVPSLARTDQERALADEVWALTPNADDSPTLYGVRGIHGIRIEAEGRSGVQLDVAETNYRVFKGTNDVFQTAEGRFAERAYALGLGHAERRDPGDLQASRLANPLSVTCVAYAYMRRGSRRQFIGVQNRNFRRVAAGKYCLQATAGGFTTVTQDTQRDDRPFEGAPPDPFRTYAREFAEEAFQLPRRAGEAVRSPIDPGDVVLLALVRDIASCWEVGLVGEVDLPFTVDDIRLGRVIPGADHWFENQPVGGRDPIEWVEASPSGLAAWLQARGGSIGDFMPFGLAAIVLLFLKRGYSPSVIHEALRPVAGRNGIHRLMRDGWEPRRHPTPDLLRRTLACWGGEEPR